MLSSTISPATEQEARVLKFFEGMGPDIEAFRQTYRDM
jgi:hypothetical protein